MNKLIPINGNVLIRRLPDRSITAGGLHIPQRAVEDPYMRGVIVAIADDALPGLKVGDPVAFAEDERSMRQRMWDGLHIVPSDRVHGVIIP